MKKFALTVITLSLIVCLSSCASLFGQTDDEKSTSSKQICRECSLRFSIVSKSCPYCFGTGHGLDICFHCGGSGILEIPLSDPSSDSKNKEPCLCCGKCRSCNETGKVFSDCDKCGGIITVDCPDC